jgi:hypothetical protein
VKAEMIRRTMKLGEISDGRPAFEAELRLRSNAVYSANPDLIDHRAEHPWVIGALGDINARVWFVAEAPSLTQAERAHADGPEHQWSVSRGDKLFRQMLVKHGFKNGNESSPGGWRCYITDVVKSLHRAGKWSKLSVEKQREIAAAWAPVLAWELETGRPELVVSVGDRTDDLLDYLLVEGLIPPIPKRTNIDHYTYVAMRPRGKLGPGHPIRVAEYDAAFAAIRADLPEAPVASAGGPRSPSDSHEQRQAETLMVAALGNELGVQLTPRRLAVGDGVHVELDAAAEDLSILVETYAHQGSVKSGHRRKVLADAFKLAFVARTLDRPSRLILLMSCEEAAKCFRRGWPAEALATFGIEMKVIEIDAAVRQELRDAQERQYR